MKGLSGKSALVTGGSSGIGQAIAIRLGQEGVNVAVNYVGQQEGAQATKDAIEQGVERCMREVRGAGARAVLVEADVSREDDVERMFKEASSELGTIDFLVNNAGIQVAKESDTLDPAAPRPSTCASSPTGPPTWPVRPCRARASPARACSSSTSRGT